MKRLRGLLTAAKSALRTAIRAGRNAAAVLRLRARVYRCRQRLVVARAVRHPAAFGKRLLGEARAARKRLGHDLRALGKCRDYSCRSGAVRRIRRDIGLVARCNVRIAAVASVPKVRAPAPFDLSRFQQRVQLTLARSRAASPAAQSVPHASFTNIVRRACARAAAAVQAQAAVSASFRASASFSFGVRASGSVSVGARASVSGSVGARASVSGRASSSSSRR